MIKVRLNSATSVTKETLQNQLKQLNCTYTVSNDKSQVMFAYPGASNPIITLQYDIKTQSVDVQMAKTNALKGNASEVSQRMDNLLEEYNKSLQSINKLIKWLAGNGADEINLLLN